MFTVCENHPLSEQNNLKINCSDWEVHAELYVELQSPAGASLEFKSTN